MTNLFGSIFANSLTVGSFLLAIITSMVLGVVLSLVVMYKNKYTKSFISALVLIPAIETVVIMLVNDNLGIGLTVAGSFALIRFRSVKGNARELAAVFMAMTIGIICGTGYLMVAVLFTLVLCVSMFLLTVLNFGEQPKSERVLRITIPESLNYDEVLDEVLEKYTDNYELEQVKTLSLGSLFRLDYNVTLKKGTSIKQMIDELRTRNGNLEIVCSKASVNREEL